MAQPVQIHIKRVQVGRLEFVETEDGLRRSGARRTASGFVMNIPARLTLDWQPGPWQPDQWQPVVTNLHASIFYDDNSGLELGEARDISTYMARNPRLDAREVALEWHGSHEALALIEQKRNGGAPKFWIRCTGEAYPAFSTNQNVMPDIRGVSERIYGEDHVTYPRDAWAQQMDAITNTRRFIVEIPARKDLPPAWNEISGALDEAKRHLSLGGDDGWKACVVAVRRALEEWQHLEKEDIGPGWVAPKQPDREARTKANRVDAVRWHLLQLAHLSPHSAAENWTRKDAVLAFTALAALLAERDP